MVWYVIKLTPKVVHNYPPTPLVSKKNCSNYMRHVARRRFLSFSYTFLVPVGFLPYSYTLHVHICSYICPTPILRRNPSSIATIVAGCRHEVVVANVASYHRSRRSCRRRTGSRDTWSSARSLDPSPTTRNRPFRSRGSSTFSILG